MTQLTADEAEVTALRARLGVDLRVAMKARDTIAASAIRSLLARLDNASAVEQTSAHVAVFGRSGDVPRRFLSWPEVQDMLRDEAVDREQASATYENLQQHAEAKRLRDELHVIGQYISVSGNADL